MADQNFRVKRGLEVGIGGTVITATATGSVGIGTNNPSAKLDVVGGTTTDGGEVNLVVRSSNADIIPTTILTGDSNATLQVFSGGMGSGSTRGGQIDFVAGAATTNRGTLIFRTGTATGGTSQPERVRIDASGNVGIGTTNPTSKLEVLDGPTGTAGQLRLRTTGDVGIANTAVFLRLNDVNGNAGYFGFGGSVNQLDIWNYKNGPIRIGTNSAEAVRVSAGGSVGIGTNSPTAALTIGTAGIASDGRSQIYLNGATSNRIDFNQNGVAAPTLIGTSGTTRSAGTKIVLYPSSSGSQVDFGFGIEPNYLWQSAPVASSAQGFKWYAGTTELAILRGDGNLGIGTTNPTAKLHVSGGDIRVDGINPQIFLKETDVTNTPEWGITADAGSFSVRLNNAVPYASVIYTNATNDAIDKLALTHTGSYPVLIGSATSTGTANQTLQVHSGGAYFNGNVGIGTTNPGEKLQVDGNVRVGVSTFSNYISFYGTTADQPGQYNHTYIGERIWDLGSERSELLLFKGNDADVNSGPDRIRLAAGEIRFDTYTTATSGSFEGIGTSANITNKVIITGIGSVGIGTANPGFRLDVQTTSSDVASFKGGTAGTLLTFNNNTLDDYKIGGVNIVAPLVVYNNTDARYEMVFDGTGNVLIGSQTATGTASQPLQVTGGAYVSGNLGIGRTNPSVKLEVLGGASLYSTNTAAVASLSASNSGVFDLTSYFATGATMRFILADSGGNNTERARFDASGNLGIGTTNPTSNLHVIGNIKATTSIDTDTQFLGQPNDTVSTPSYSWTSDTTTGFYRPSSGNLAFSVNGVEELRINTTGVGIGTTNPTQALHVQGNTLITGIATVSSTLIASSDVTFNTTASNINLGTSQTTGRLILGGPSQTGQITLGFSVSTHTLGIATGASGVGTTKTINLGTGGLSGSNTQINIGPSAGSGVISVGTGVSVGIGTAIFNALGHGGTNVITQINNTGITTNSQSHLILSSAAAAQANSSVGTISWGLPTASATNKGIAYIAGLTGSGSTTGALSGKLVFATRNTTDSQFAERMVLNESGRVGIGSTLPTAALTIATVGSATTGASQIYLNGATSNRIDFNTNGAAPPAFTTRSAGTKIVLYPALSGSGVDYAFGIEDNTLWSSIPDSTHQFKWYAGTTNIAVLKGDGSLGIGITNPGNNLQVAGPDAGIRLTDTTGGIGDLSSTGWLLYQRASNSIESASGFSIKKDSGADVLTINSSGNLGIGITDPSTLLHLHSTDPTIRLKRSDAATNAYGEITSDTSGLITLKSDPDNAAANSGFSLTVDNTERVRVSAAGSVGIGTNLPASRLHILGGTATAGTAPLEIAAGTLLTTPEADTFEYDGRLLYHTANDVTNGNKRALIPEVQFIRNTANVAISSTASPGTSIFGTNARPALLAGNFYDVEMVLFLAKGTSNGSITYQAALSTGNFTTMNILSTNATSNVAINSTTSPVTIFTSVSITAGSQQGLIIRGIVQPASNSRLNMLLYNSVGTTTCYANSYLRVTCVGTASSIGNFG